MAIVFLRTVIVFAALLTAMRLMGKRQLGELELSELVVAVLISDMAAHPLQDIGIPLLNGIIPIITLLCFELILTGLTNKSIRFHAFLCGKPSILIEDGKINEKEMRKNRFTLDELFEELRQNGISDISCVKYAILETNGSLTALLFPSAQPPTRAEMNIGSPSTGELPVIVINDGRTVSANLRYLGFDERWLRKTLEKHGVKDSREVYLLTSDKSGRTFFAAKEKK